MVQSAGHRLDSVDDRIDCVEGRRIEPARQPRLLSAEPVRRQGENEKEDSRFHSRAEGMMVMTDVGSPKSSPAAAGRWGSATQWLPSTRCM